MDNHPIPQDVTGFQFKLVGNMTVKQFAYLATGVVFAGILWQLPVSVLIKFPVCAFFVILGLGLAYFPVSGRPMDLMIGNYIKALFRPTQFVYEKAGGQIYFPNKIPLAATRSAKQYKNGFGLLPKDKLKAYLESLDAKPKNRVDEKENSFLTSVFSLSVNNLPQADPQASPAIREQNVPAPQLIPAIQPPKIQQSAPSPMAPLVKTTKPVLTGFKKTVEMNTPDFPNLITGITKDPRGNALPNIMIEIKDKEGNPVRAFKTNEVGRFASATPLVNGIYTVEFEDPKAQNKFEKTTINATGQIISPIEAISIDTREELRRSLFSVN